MQDTDFQILIVQRFPEFVVLGILAWFAIHYLYERGLLGNWPPNRFVVRIGIWVFALFPLVAAMGLIGIAVLIDTLFPATEAAADILVQILYSVLHLFIVVVFSLVAFRTLRWCWRAYGAAGVVTTISIAYSTGVILSFVGLTSSVVQSILEESNQLWVMMSFLLACWLNDALKLGKPREPTRVTFIGPNSISLTMKRIYGVIVPLVRRIRIDRDPQALATLKEVLQTGTGLDRTMALACKALGFERSTILSTDDIENAHHILGYVDTKWGNLSRIDIGVLSGILAIWIPCMIASVWIFINGLMRQYLLLFMLDLIFPLAVVMLLSLIGNYKTDREYHMAKRHDDMYQFTNGEFGRRRIFDLAIIIAALAGVAAATLFDLAIYSSTQYMLPLLVVYVFSFLILALDDFAKGKKPSIDEEVALIRKKLPDIGIDESLYDHPFRKHMNADFKDDDVH